VKIPLSRFALLGALLVLVLGIAGCGGEKAATNDLYTCPMHPTYVSDRPGNCPICNMDLVLQSSLAKPAGGEAAGGMETHAAVEVGDEARRLAGVATEEARSERLQREVRAVGSVVADERRQVKAQSKVSGWVEELAVGATGQFVKKGQTAMAVYSPALLAAQSEYLLARDASARFAGSELPEVRRGGQDLLVAARRRLELLDVSSEFLAELDRTRVPKRTIDLLVPASGFVTSKSVVLGQEIAPGMELYTVTDLSRIWVEAAFFETDARYVAVGSKATLVLPFAGEAADARREARVSYVYPTLDPAARTLTARFELANPKLDLRPGMFVDVELEVDLGEAVTVPDSAVLDSGLRKILFVESSPGHFDPREVETGERTGGRVAIRHGVAAGERVATKANFLLDAESRLRASIGRAADGAPDPHAEHR
jgi:Cu(I)/Ag(I) efflux system membrane fusion protein